MASALDELRKHTAALQAVVKAAQEIESVLERVRAELVPPGRRSAGSAKRNREDPKARDADGFSWTVLVVICSGLGGIVGGGLGRAGILQVISEAAGLPPLWGCFQREEVPHVVIPDTQ